MRRRIDFDRLLDDSRLELREAGLGVADGQRRPSAVISMPSPSTRASAASRAVSTDAGVAQRHRDSVVPARKVRVADLGLAQRDARLVQRRVRDAPGPDWPCRLQAADANRPADRGRGSPSASAPSSAARSRVARLIRFGIASTVPTISTMRTSGDLPFGEMQHGSARPRRSTATALAVVGALLGLVLLHRLGLAGNRRRRRRARS